MISHSFGYLNDVSIIDALQNMNFSVNLASLYFKSYDEWLRADISASRIFSEAEIRLLGIGLQGVRCRCFQSKLRD